jgi:hypothetical protein
LTPEKGDAAPVADPLRKLNFGGAAGIVDFAAPNGDCEVAEPAPNTLGFPEAPKAPKGEADEDPRAPNGDLEGGACSFLSVGSFEVSVVALSVLDGLSKLDLAEWVVDEACNKL